MVKRESLEDSKSKVPVPAAAAASAVTPSQHQSHQQQQASTDTSWSCINNGGMSGLFPMFDPDSYASYFQNFPMGDSEMMGGDDGGGDDPLGFLMDYLDDSTLPLPISAPTPTTILTGGALNHSSYPNHLPTNHHHQNMMMMTGFDDNISNHSIIHDFSDPFLQSKLPFSLNLNGDMMNSTNNLSAGEGYNNSTNTATCTNSTTTNNVPSVIGKGSSVGGVGSVSSFPSCTTLPSIVLQKPQPLQYPSPSSSTTSSPRAKGNFLPPPPAKLYHHPTNAAAASSSGSAANHSGQKVQQLQQVSRGEVVGGGDGDHPSLSLINLQLPSLSSSSIPVNNTFYNSILNAQLLQRNTPSTTSSSMSPSRLRPIISSTSQKSSPKSSSMATSEVVAVMPGEERGAKLDLISTSTSLTSSSEIPGIFLMKDPFGARSSNNHLLPGIQHELKTTSHASNTTIPPACTQLQQQHEKRTHPMIVSCSDTDGETPSGNVIKKGKNHEYNSSKKAIDIHVGNTTSVAAPKKGRIPKSKVKIEKPPSIPTGTVKGNFTVPDMESTNPPLNEMMMMMIPPSSTSGGATTTSTTNSTISSDDTKIMNLDYHPQQQEEMDDDPTNTEEDKTHTNRERNREHARNTRLRKKAYVENLKQTLDDLCKERDALLLERTEAAKTLVETNQTQVQVLLTFFALRAQCEKRRTALASIMDENISCIFPITPYRSFPSNEVQVAKCQRTIMGIDGMIADSASLNVLLNSFVDRSRFPEGQVEYYYDVIVEEAVAAGNQMMVRWKLSTTNLESLGAQNEVKKYGMLCARFNSSHKIVAMEIMFDVMAFMLQLKQCSRNQEFTIVPNTLQTCQGFHSIPMVITIAEKPYTIIQVNRTWELLTGWMAEEVVGKASCKILQGPQTNMKDLESLLTEIRFKRPARSVLVNYTKGMTYMFRNFLNFYPLSTDSKITHYVSLTTHFERMQHGEKRTDTGSEISLGVPLFLNGSVNVPLSSSSNVEGAASVALTYADGDKDEKLPGTQSLDNT